MGYHVNKIPKGVLGENSKIVEEFLELQDAYEQGNIILQICEMCDLIGAIEAKARVFNLTLQDLVVMKDATKQAFLDGERK